MRQVIIEMRHGEVFGKLSIDRQLEDPHRVGGIDDERKTTVIELGERSEETVVGRFDILGNEGPGFFRGFEFSLEDDIAYR